MKKHKRILRHLSKDIRYRIIENIGTKKLLERVQNVLEAELLLELSDDADQCGGHVWASLKGKEANEKHSPVPMHLFVVQSTLSAWSRDAIRQKVRNFLL